MTIFRNKTKQIYSLHEVENEKFNLIKGYRDICVLVKCRRLKQETLLNIYQFLKKEPNYLKIFRLREPFYKRTYRPVVKYLGAVIFLNFTDVEVYIADLYITLNSRDEKCIMIRFGTESYYNDMSISFYKNLRRPDYVELYELIRQEYKRLGEELVVL